MDIMEVKEAVYGDISKMNENAEQLKDVTAEVGTVPELQTAKMYASLHRKIHKLIGLYAELVEKDADNISEGVKTLEEADKNIGTSYGGSGGGGSSSW